MATLTLLLDRAGDGLRLLSPEVGYFSCALPQGSLLAPRARAGVLHSLGRRFELVVPAEATGRVLNAPPEAVLAPVSYGSVLYELAALAAPATDSAAAPAGASKTTGALLFRAPYAGRFWQRPSPNDAPFVQAGDVLAEGQTIGLLEVMKTFTELVYRAIDGLPPRARVLRVVLSDGDEVELGGALLELERG